MNHFICSLISMILLLRERLTYWLRGLERMQALFATLQLRTPLRYTLTSGLRHIVAREASKIMLLNISPAIFSLVLLFGVAGTNLAQDQSSNERGCALIDKKNPPQFILYEGKSDLKVRLRLRNNTNCAIVVETDDKYPTQIKKLPSGGVRIESVLDSQDGLRLRLHYLIQNRQRREPPKPAYGWGDSVFVYEIPAGQSIVFDVPANYFKRRFDIAVPFDYAWEGSKSIGMGTGGVVHRVYFLFEDLPSGVLR